MAGQGRGVAMICLGDGHGAVAQFLYCPEHRLGLTEELR